MTYYNKEKQVIEHFLYGSLSLEEFYTIHPLNKSFYSIALSCMTSNLRGTLFHIKTKRRSTVLGKLTDYLYLRAAFVFCLYVNFQGFEKEIKQYAKDKVKPYGRLIANHITRLTYKLDCVMDTIKMTCVLGLFDPLDTDPAFPFAILLRHISTKNSINDQLIRSFGYDPIVPTPFIDNVRRLTNPFPENLIFGAARMIQTISISFLDHSSRLRKKDKMDCRIRNTKDVLQLFFRLGYDVYNNEAYCRCNYHYQHSYPKNYSNYISTIGEVSSDFSRPDFCNAYCVIWRLIVNIYVDFAKNQTLFDKLYDTGIIGINYF